MESWWMKGDGSDIAEKAKAHWINQPGKQCVMNKHNVSFNVTVAVPLGDTSAVDGHKAQRHDQRNNSNIKDGKKDLPEALEHEGKQ
jgi:hypothetical protein